MPRTIGTLALMLMLLGLGGCSYFFYPRAGDYASQAKGATTLDTMSEDYPEPRNRSIRQRSLRELRRVKS